MDEAFSVGGTLFGMGLIFISIAVLLHVIFQYRKNRATAITTAAVVDLIKRRSRNGIGATYSPIYEFYVDGELLRVESSLSSSPCPFHPGEQVELHFVPGNPRRIFVEKEQRVFRLISIVFICVGFLIFVLGLVLWIALD